MSLPNTTNTSNTDNSAAVLPKAGEDWDEGNEEDLTVIQDCYCPCCNGSSGTTTMLPTRVPFFREIIVMHIDCPDCGFRNSEVTFGGQIQERGERIVLTVQNTDDLNRQIIKSDSASLLIPNLEFEIPPTTQRGTVSTLEGMLRTAADKLNEQQPDRLKLGDIDNFHRCQTVIQALRRYAGEKEEEDDDSDDDTPQNIFPFQIILDDPAGNSFIENPKAPNPDPQLNITHYYRTPTQDMALGLQPSEQAKLAGTIDDTNPKHKNIVNVPSQSHTIEIDSALDLTKTTSSSSLGRQEVLKFPTICSHCYKPTETDMCVVDIPHFKEVIIMSMVCESCGYKSNEIKGGGGIPKYGTQITVQITSPDDLAREVLKSDTAGIEIPQLDLELSEGGLDGVYTTVEGLLQKMHQRLESANPFGTDSAVQQHTHNDGGNTFSEPSPNYMRYKTFLHKLQDMANGKILPFTLIISDPLSNSFVGPIPKDAIALSLQAEKDGNNQCYQDYVDPGMEIEEYERTFEQNETLGLNDIKTENYISEETNLQTTMYYGTDTMEEIPDRIRRLDVRGPDHPHAVGKAPVGETDTTVMGPGSTNFAVPAMGQRGKFTIKLHHHENTSSTSTETPSSTETNPHVNETIQKILHEHEKNDDTFMMDEEYQGPRPGMVFKDGAQGLGYYTDIPLQKLWQQQHPEL